MVLGAATLLLFALAHAAVVATPSGVGVQATDVRRYTTAAARAARHRDRFYGSHSMLPRHHSEPGNLRDSTECPDALSAEVNRTGRLSVRSTGAVGCGAGCHDDSVGVRLAINMSRACGRNGPITIWFPPGEYWLNSTVYLEQTGLLIEGSSGGSGQGVMPPQTTIAGPADGPAFWINNTEDGLTIRDLAISGVHVGVIIQNSAGVRFTNVHIDASVYSNATTGPGCNVDLGSWNAPLVIENSYWFWAEQCSFVMGWPSASAGKGQRPSVIMRGTCDAAGYSLNPPSVYLVVFKEIVFYGGGVQYQQTCENAGGAIGWFDFFNTVLEASATALLDVQSDPRLHEFYGVEHVNIIDYMDADSVPAVFHPADTHANTTAVVTVNCSQPMCNIDGFTLSGAAALGMGYDQGHIGPAVRIYAGGVRSVTLLDSAGTGSLEVVDASGRPAGSFASKSPGGWLLVAPAANSSGASLLATDVSPNGGLPSTSRGSGHALLVGLPGEQTGRMALDTDGSMRFGPGGTEPFDTHVQRLQATSVTWDPPPLAGGHPDFAKLVVTVPSAAAGDLVTASHDTLGESPVQLSASASTGKAVVFLRALGSGTVDVPSGTLTILLTKVRST